MSGREQILARVRRALQRENGRPPKAEPPAVRLRPRTATVEERIESFRDALAKLNTEVHVAQNRAAAEEYTRSFVAGRPACGILCDPVETSSAEVGITGADYGLADTGSLVVFSATDPRLASLLPPVHIALLPVSRLLTGLDELFTIVPRPADHTASMVFITGPSRTADIEQILVRGVHGPGELRVVLFH